MQDKSLIHKIWGRPKNPGTQGVFLLTRSVPFIIDKNRSGWILLFSMLHFTMWYKANCNVSSFHWTHFCSVNPGQSKHHKISTLKLEWILEVASAHTWLMNTSCPLKWFPIMFYSQPLVMRIAMPHPEVPSMLKQLWKAVVPNVDMSAFLLIC